MPSRADVVGWLDVAIRRGDYGISGKLPSETELMARYQASRNTVRDALQDLQAAELVESRNRLGWYVRPDTRRDYALTSVSPAGWGAYCRQEGMTGRQQDIAVERKDDDEPPVVFRSWQARDAITGEWVTWALHLDSEPGRTDLSVIARAGTADELAAFNLPRRAAVLEVNRAGERFVFDARLVRFLA